MSAGGIRRGSGAYASGSSPSLVEFTVSNQIENANFQVINRDTSREAKTRGQGRRNERNPITGPQLVLSIRDPGFLSGNCGVQRGRHHTVAARLIAISRAWGPADTPDF